MQQHQESVPPSLPPRRAWWRSLLRAARAGITAAVLLGIAVLIVAHVVRDRAVWLSFCLYVPMWSMAIIAVGWDLLNLGRALPLRFLLFLVGCGMGVMSVGMMWAPPRAPEGDASQSAVNIVQWNMQWGGLSGPSSLDVIVSTILANDPQIVCLSEVPHESYFGHYWKQHAGPGWHGAFAVGGERYMCRVAVLSKSPVRRVRQWPLDHGEAVLFEIDLADMPARPFRVLMVDLESEPSIPRSPSIVQAAEIVDGYAVAGTPIDIVAGDFNTPSRFRGFDAVTNAGERYERAALWSGQWRATWPARLLVPFRGKMREFRDTWRLSTLDIDHLFVRSGLDVVTASIFTTNVVDHRGQVCTIRLPRRGNEP